MISVPGKRIRSRVKAKRQMDGRVSSSGSWGCSRTPKPSTHANEKRSSRENRRSSLPVATWSASRMLRELKPHSSAMSLSGRGPCRHSCPWSSGWLAYLACDQVSQGGPQRAPQTHPDFTPCSQKACVAGLRTLPQSLSIIKSRDTTQRVVPSMQVWS